MNSINLIRSELRKLITTRMPVAFGAVLVVLAAINGVAVVAGTDMDGSKTFISTGFDQQSLMAFAANALMLVSCSWDNCSSSTCCCTISSRMSAIAFCNSTGVGELQRPMANIENASMSTNTESTCLP